jgi:DNA replication protein DnaC
MRAAFHKVTPEAAVRCMLLIIDDLFSPRLSERAVHFRIGKLGN